MKNGWTTDTAPINELTNLYFFESLSTIEKSFNERRGKNSTTQVTGDIEM